MKKWKNEYMPEKFQMNMRGTQAEGCARQG